MKKVYLFLLCVTVSAISMNAQVTIGETTEPQSFSILELRSKDRGLRLPQLTTEQRDAIADLKNNAEAVGLHIYNTDTNCEEYWNGNEWISLCQASSNPEVTIPAEACSRIRVYGQYYANSPLNSTNYMVIPVTVTQKGNYNIIANGNNGYYFQASGVFDTTGSFDLQLEGMGTPAINQTDQIVITCNGTSIASCDIKVVVAALTMGYRVDCDSISVQGSYQTRSFMDGSNFVKIPIEVLQTGLTSVTTDAQNGIKFSGTQTLSAYGPDTLVLRADGSPRQEGTYRFTFTTDGSLKTTCSFSVDFFSTLGSFNDPACNCMAIYNERPFATNGEYWLQDCVVTTGDVSPTRTFCDIVGGGWTLVWSYSENTARNTYVQSTSSGGTGRTNTMIVEGSYYAVFVDRPINRITDSVANDGPTNYRIPYENFRLNKNEWLNLPSTNTSQMKVRIADNPTDMNDEWGLNNYAIISPRTVAENPLRTNFADNRSYVPTTGMIYGKRWQVSGSGANYGGWDEVTGSRGILLYNSNGYCTHWDWGNLGSSALFDVTPNRGGASNQISINNINNSFGWFGETQPNHHFGKCGATGDDYSFSTRTCGNGDLYPHSFNNGQGRYLQWFVR
ncbi:MAG: hypothetical protein FWF53_13105 [Candidatus Azobacteroides sp.]|nr:hypothetical protein [Candidatus Azobacteroides sp.]